MDPAFQKKFAPKDIDISYQDPGSRHLLQNRQLHTESVTQHHQMYRDYTVQQPSISNTMVPQYAQTHRAEAFQQHFNNRQVHQDVGAPPLLATQDHMFANSDKKCKSKRGFSADDDGKAGKKEFICKFCQKVFLWDNELNQHLATHSREKPYGCEDCARRFNQKRLLTKHRLRHTSENFNREVHQDLSAPSLLATKDRVFAIRSKKCKSKSDLSADNDRKAGKKPFMCKFCPKGFRCESALKRHLLIHSRKEPYECKDCFRRFNQKGTLKRHMLTHTGEKPYVCTICEQAFAQKYNLKSHSEIHTGENKYICEICNKCFIRKYHLNRHQNKQHSENIVFKQKKANKNTKVSKTQEVRNTESELEQQRICMKQQRQLPQSTGYLAQMVATFVGSKSFHEQASLTNVHLGTTANTQSFVPIEQPSMHMVPQFLNLDARLHPLINPVGQENISHSVPHVLRQIGHMNPGRIDHQSLAFLRQAVDIINHTLTPDVNQFNIGAQSLNQLITVDQQDVSDLGYQGLAQMGHHTHDQIGHPSYVQLPNRTRIQPSMFYPVHSTMAAVSKNQEQTSMHAACLTL